MQLSHRSGIGSRVAVLGVLVAFALALAPGAALAQDDDDEGGTPLKGQMSLSFAYGFEQTNLDFGGDLDDSQGLDFAIGFEAGQYFAFNLGWEWQSESDFDTHYFPAAVRFYSPVLLERVRLFGTTGIGLFFTRTHDSLARNGNEKASAFHVGGGGEIEITKQLSALCYAKYKKGLGSVDDWESAVVGLGLQYSWGL